MEESICKVTTAAHQNEELAADAVTVIIQQQHGRWGAQRFWDL